MHISNSAHSNMNNNIIYFQVICRRVLTRRVFLRRLFCLGFANTKKLEKVVIAALTYIGFVFGRRAACAKKKKPELGAFS